MKHYYLSFFIATLMSMAYTMASAHDIAVFNRYAKTIYYDYNTDGTSVSVTHRGRTPTEYSYEYRGEIVIPETITYSGKTYSVTSIDGGAFYDCIEMTSVTIPNSVTSIGSGAFRDCSRLTSVTIPNSVTSIDRSAFSGCSRLTSIIWNAKNYPAFSSISSSPFYCIRTQITEFIIGDDVTSIPSDMCYGLSNLKSVTIPNSVTSIGSYVFYDCDGLTSVTIGNSVTSIGSSAFYGCSGLTSVTIPNSVTSIGNEAFSRCKGLTSVTIPESVTSIGNGVFAFCSGLTEIKVADGNNVYDSRNNCNAIINTSSNTFIAGCKNTIIPNSVTSIGSGAFWGCSSLTSVTIPNSVTSIGSWAFSGCSGLKSVTIPNSVTSIGEWAFAYCSGLTSVNIGNNVTSIDKYAFTSSMSMTKFKIRATVPPTCGTQELNDIIKKTCTLYVVAESICDYQVADLWKDFIHIEKLNAHGDSNGDDVVNEIDYSGVASYIMGDTPAAFDAEASDVDVNGTVDVRDYVGIANIISTGSIYGGASNNAKAAMSKGSVMPATDESDAENVIYVENVSGSKNSQVELSVRMKNASDIRGFQFDLYLPEGVTIANNAKASLSSDRLATGDAHTLMVNEVSDGVVRFLCCSMNDESFAGGDGEIATLTVNIADNVANGEYDVVVKNALMTETDISRSYEADDIKSTLTVLDQTGVETVTADDERRDGTIYTVGGLLMGKKSTTSQLRKGIYIRNGKKIVVK